MELRPFPAIPNRGRHIREYPLEATADYAVGAVLVFDAGELDEAAVNPTAIVGFSAEPSEYPGGQDFNPGNRLVFVAEANSTFWISGGEYESPDLVPVEPLPAHVGVIYGLTKDVNSGIWYLDFDKSGADQRAIVEDIDQARGLFEIRILDANRVLD